MDYNVFMPMLMIASVATGLVVEAVKKLLDEHDKTYYPNTLAGICSVVTSVVIGAAYVIYNSIDISPDIIVSLIMLVLATWLCSMVGYDKVIESITQRKAN